MAARAIAGAFSRGRKNVRQSRRGEMTLPPSSADRSEKLTIKVRYEKSDLYLAVLRNVMRHPLCWLTPLALGSLTAALFVDYEYGWIIAVVVGFVSFSLIPYCAIRTAGNQFENGTNSAAWSLVKGALETDKFIFIAMQRSTFHLVPKRQITNDRATLLRKVLRTYISRNVHLQNDSLA